MRGPFPARSWPAGRSRPWARAMLPLAVAAVSATSQSGCDRIDRSQWRDFSTSTTTVEPGRTTTAGSGSTTVVTAGNGDVTVEQRVQVDTNDPAGVVHGQRGGGTRSSTATVVVTTASSTCWILVVDGNSHRGCGNATITDTRGERAGRVIKLSGSQAIQLQLVQDGQTLSSGSVSGDNRYVTVRA